MKGQESSNNSVLFHVQILLSFNTVMPLSFILREYTVPHICAAVAILRQIECVVTLTVFYVVPIYFANNLLRERSCRTLVVSYCCATVNLGKYSNLLTLLSSLVVPQGTVIPRRTAETWFWQFPIEIS